VQLHFTRFYMSNQKRDKIPILLSVLFCFLCWFFVRHGIFGSMVDWISQHSVFPDYFRQLFYETGKFFPSFAPNIGGGQNIYNFSYYGLYSPIILLSYLLPFVKMGSYVMISSAACYVLSIVLFYLWIRGKCENRWAAAGITCMFGLSAPLLYQSYNQLMFVDYMMFLIIALIGTDQYLKEKKSLLLILGTFLMIMTSFYFSIGGLIALILYGSSTYLRSEEVLSVRGFFSCALRYVYRLGIAVLMSGILLIPTAHTLGGGRKEPIHMTLQWLIPKFKPTRFLYSPYGLGLSAFGLTVLITGLFYRGWREKLLSAELLILLCVPAFGYLLNGGLYDKDKVFIPLLPIICYLVVIYLEKLRQQEMKLQFFAIPCLITIVLIYFSRFDIRYEHSWAYSMIEAVITFSLFLICTYYKRTDLLPVFSCFVLFVIGYGISVESDIIVPKDFYREVTSSSYKQAVEKTVKQDPSMYRMEQFGDADMGKANLNRIHNIHQFIGSLYSSSYNADYQDFRTHTFQLNEPFRNDMMQPATDNPLFLRFMGVKYLITDMPPADYNPVLRENEANVWKDEHAAPIIYSTNQLISEDSYKKLAFPQNETALLQAAVVPKADETKVQNIFDPSDFTLPLVNQKHLKIEPAKDGNGYEITADQNTQIKVSLPPDANNNLLALDFSVKNHRPNKNMYVKLSHQANRLSSVDHSYANHNENFTYVVSVKPGADTIHMTFGKGRYRLYNMKAYRGLLGNLNNTGLYQNEFKPEQKKMTGDAFYGSVEAGQGSYLITSIPYDRGFTILVDGKKVPIQKVNTAFLGCKLPAGTHQIAITYRAPGLTAGIAASILGTALFLILLAVWHYKNNQNYIVSDTDS